MEKRLLVAFLLSICVVSVWSAVTSRQNPSLSQQNNSVKEDIAAYSSVTYDQTVATELKADLPKMSSLDNSADKSFHIDNKQLTVTFSSRGGNITEVLIKEFGDKLPLGDLIGIPETNNEVFQVASQSEYGIEFRLNKGGIEYTKRYELDDGYIVHANVYISNKSSKEVLEEFRLDNFRLDNSRMDNSNSRDHGLVEYSVADQEKIYRKGNAVKFSKKDTRSKQSNLRWTGFRNHYFCVVIKPLFESFGYNIIPENDQSLVIRSNIRPKNPINIGDTAGFQHLIYFGPQNLSILRSYGQGIEEVMAFSNYGLLNFVSMTIYKTLIFTHKYSKSWGVSILLVSFLIYGLMYPLTMSGMKSMRKMQALQPVMAQLREKHKSNPQKMNQEMMELYKEHRVNPFGGCLPFLLQMPIFIGLYQVLWRSVHFKGAEFLWIKDLSEPDRLITFKTSLPLVGNEFNILPLIMTVIMFFQQKLSAKNMVVTDPAQIAQQKMMATVFPVFLGFIFYKFASGLCLYFVVFYTMSTFTQWKISKAGTS